MSWISRVVNVFRSSDVDLDDEMGFHIESRIDELVAAGMSCEEAETARPGGNSVISCACAN